MPSRRQPRTSKKQAKPAVSKKRRCGATTHPPEPDAMHLPRQTPEPDPESTSRVSKDTSQVAGPTGTGVGNVVCSASASGSPAIVGGEGIVCWGNITIRPGTLTEAINDLDHYLHLSSAYALRDPKDPHHFESWKALNKAVNSVQSRWRQAETECTRRRCVPYTELRTFERQLDEWMDRVSPPYQDVTIPDELVDEWVKRRPDFPRDIAEQLLRDDERRKRDAESDRLGRELLREADRIERTLATVRDQTPDEPEWQGPFTTEECAKRFKISENTWRNWAKGKSCPEGIRIKKVGKRGKWVFVDPFAKTDEAQSKRNKAQ